MVDKSTDHGKLLLICFYNNIDGRYPFPFKFLGKSRAREKKNELPHHHVISTICTLIEHSYPSISAREIARLLKKKKKRFLDQPRSQGPSASRRSRRGEGESLGKRLFWEI